MNTVPWDVPGATWDSPQLKWDMQEQPIAKGNNMAQVKIPVNSMPDNNVFTLTETICNSMTGNQNFPTPKPTLVAVLAALTAGRAGAADALQAYEVAKQKTLEKNRLMAVLRALLVQLANYVENESGGDAVKIESAGMQVRKTPSPVGPLNPPTNVRVKPSDKEGELLVAWKKPKSSATCEVQQKNGSPTATWDTIAILTQSKFTATGLTSGAEYSFRVRAIGTAGPSAWTGSEPKKVA